MDNKLLSFIKEELVEHDGVILEDTNLLELGLDSIKMMRLVAFIENEFDIYLPADYINPFEMYSIKKIKDIIKSLTNSR